MSHPCLRPLNGFTCVPRTLYDGPLSLSLPQAYLLPLPLPLALSLSSPLTIFQFLHCIRLSPAPGPLHMLTPLPGTCFSHALHALHLATPLLLQIALETLYPQRHSFLLPLSQIGSLASLFCMTLHASFAPTTCPCSFTCACDLVGL